MGKGLTGNVVMFSSSTFDLFYNCPDLEGAEFLGSEREDADSGKKVQLNFRLKNGQDWSILVLQSMY